MRTSYLHGHLINDRFLNTIVINMPLKSISEILGAGGKSSTLYIDPLLCHLSRTLGGRLEREKARLVDLLKPSLHGTMDACPTPLPPKRHHLHHLGTSMHATVAYLCCTARNTNLSTFVV